MGLIKINNFDVQTKECRNQRVVTFKDIDMVHSRPEGTAKRNFNENLNHFINGTDYFYLEKPEIEGVRNSYGLDNRINSIYLITESGYLMLVKSFTDDLAWKVQHELVNNYFRTQQKASCMEDIWIAQIQEMKAMRLQLTDTQKKVETVNHRINSLDCTNIQGTPQQRLNAMVRKYAYDHGIVYGKAWDEFKKMFNTSYHTNIEEKKNYYMGKQGIKSLSLPAYLTRAGLIEDSLRVADKMLNEEA